MDTLTHSLWSLVGGRVAKSRTRWTTLAFWGALPDLVWLPFTGWELITTHRLEFFMSVYRWSHSLIIWGLITLFMTMRWRRAVLWTWPWALHIAFDIPGHQDMYTPFLWPISDFSVPGWFDWLSPQNILLTYAALALCWGIIWWRQRKVLPKIK